MHLHLGLNTQQMDKRVSVRARVHARGEHEARVAARPRNALSRGDSSATPPQTCSATPSPPCELVRGSQTGERGAAHDEKGGSSSV